MFDVTIQSGGGGSIQIFDLSKSRNTTMQKYSITSKSPEFNMFI